MNKKFMIILLFFIGISFADTYIITSDYSLADVTAYDVSENQYQFQSKFNIEQAKNILGNSEINHVKACFYLVDFNYENDKLRICRVNDREWEENIEISDYLSQELSLCEATQLENINQEEYSCFDITSQFLSAYEEESYFSFRVVADWLEYPDLKEIDNGELLTLGDTDADYYVFYSRNSESEKLPYIEIEYTPTEPIPSFCQTLYSDYTLINDVSSAGTCFTFGADNITLDCNGHIITFDTAGNNNKYGIYTNGFDYLNIKNCKIISTGGGNGKFGVRIGTGTYYSNMSNLEVLVNGQSSYGLELGNSRFNNLMNLKISVFGLASHGLVIESYSQNNKIKNVNITTNNTNAFGIFFIEASNSNHIDNAQINSTGTAIYFDGSIEDTKSNIISNSTILNMSSDSVFCDSFTYDNVLINTTINKSKITLYSSSNLTVQWYAKVNVKDEYENPLSANVNVSDAFGTNVFYGYVSSTPWFLVNDTIFRSQGNITFNNHKIITKKRGYYDSILNLSFSERDRVVNVYLYPLSMVNGLINIFGFYFQNQNCKINVFGVNECESCCS
ncbi:MAG: hypothetical protein ABIM64_01685 [candidate division WOR-3 bacterium]